MIGDTAAHDASVPIDATSDGLRFGLFAFQTASSMPPHKLAVTAEERGFESLWFTEHTNIPTSRATPYPAGGELPRQYAQLFDPFACIAAAAVVTERLTLATGVMLPAQRDPILTAKEISTVDVLSGGRVKIGVGFGWNREEMANHGRDPRLRYEIGRDHLLAMRELWTKDEASFAGDHYRLESCWQWPKPVQDPHPPIYIGGQATAATFERIAEFGNGWLPLGGVGVDDQGLRHLSEALARHDRSLSEIDIVPYSIVPDPARLEQLQELGVSQVVLKLPAGDESGTLATLDEYQKAMDR